MTKLYAGLAVLIAIWLFLFGAVIVLEGTTYTEKAETGGSYDINCTP
jgi:hypothetical protein